MANDGYIFVRQDCRGRYKSEGTMEIHLPLIHSTQKNAIDESTDTYDLLPGTHSFVVTIRCSILESDTVYAANIYANSGWEIFPLSAKKKGQPWLPLFPNSSQLYYFFGSNTASITWVTPLLDTTSAVVTLAPLIITLPSFTETIRSLPFTVLSF